MSRRVWVLPATLLAVYTWVTVVVVLFTRQGPGSDRAALVALYEATDGPNLLDDANWLSDKPLHA